MNIRVFDINEYQQSEFFDGQNLNLCSRVVVDPINRFQVFEVSEYSSLSERYDHYGYRMSVFSENVIVEYKNGKMIWSAITEILYSESDAINAFLKAAFELLWKVEKDKIQIIMESPYKKLSIEQLIDLINIRSKPLIFFEKIWLGEMITPKELINETKGSLVDLAAAFAMIDERKEKSLNSKNIINYCIEDLIAMEVNSYLKYILNINSLLQELNNKVISNNQTLSENGLKALMCWQSWKNKVIVH